MSRPVLHIIICVIFAFPIGMGLLIVWPIWRIVGTPFQEDHEAIALVTLALSVGFLLASIVVAQSPGRKRL